MAVATTLTAARPASRRVARGARASQLRLSPTLSFLALLALVASARWIVLAHHHGPPGMDPGNWLAFGHALLGDSVRDPGLVYPPVVPLLSVAAVSLLGLQPGLDLLATIASLAPGAGLFVLLRATGTRWPAVVAATVLSASSSVGEAAAWGGYPQLIALGFLLAMLGALHVLLTTARMRWSPVVALLLLGALASNELVGVAAVIAGSLLVTYHAVVIRAPARGWRPLPILSAAAIVLLPTALLAPTYATLVSTVLATHQALNSSGIGVAAVVGAVAFQFRELPVFWLVALACSLFTAFTFPRWVRNPAVVAGWVLLCTTVLLVVGTSEPRFMYLLPAAALTSTVGLGQALLPTIGRKRVLGVTAAVGCAAVCAVAALAGLRFFQPQVSFYGQLTPPDAEALQWLHDSTPADAVVAVTRAGSDFTLGWWVEGVAERRALYDADLGNLNYANERSRALIAQDIFAPGATLAEMCARAEDHGITYLYLDKGWTGYGQLDFSYVDDGFGRVLRDTNSLLLVECNATLLSP